MKQRPVSVFAEFESDERLTVEDATRQFRDETGLDGRLTYVSASVDEIVNGFGIVVDYEVTWRFQFHVVPLPGGTL